MMKKGHTESEIAMKQTDYMTYRLISLGFLLLTVVILSGAIWAEQAWSRWWSWDPKETWALISWIIYAIYLHQRLRLNWQGKRMAILAVVALVSVIFTFAGVNILLPGLHSYA
jgi:cytochrome c-type biogenesis protein CcsB